MKLVTLLSLSEVWSTDILRLVKIDGNKAYVHLIWPPDSDDFSRKDFKRFTRESVLVDFVRGWIKRLGKKITGDLEIFYAIQKKKDGPFSEFFRLSTSSPSTGGGRDFSKYDAWDL